MNLLLLRTLSLLVVSRASSQANESHVEHALRPEDFSYKAGETTYILDTFANAIIVNGISTSSLPTQQTTPSLPPTITLAGATAALSSAFEHVVEGQTLTPGGPAITVSGTRISLASDAAAVVVGSSTSFLAKPTGVGDLVWAGIAGVISRMAVTFTASDGVVYTHCPSGGAAGGLSDGSREPSEGVAPQTTSSDLASSTTSEMSSSQSPEDNSSEGSAPVGPSIVVLAYAGVVGLLMLMASRSDKDGYLVRLKSFLLFVDHYLMVTAFVETFYVFSRAQPILRGSRGAIVCTLDAKNLHNTARQTP